MLYYISESDISPLLSYIAEYSDIQPYDALRRCLQFCSCLPVYDVSSKQHLRSATRLPRCPWAFSVARPSVWNSLPDSLRDLALSRDDFRRLLSCSHCTEAFSVLDVLYDDTLYKL